MKGARKIVYYGSLVVIAVTACFLIYYFYTTAHEADVYKELQATAEPTATPAPTQAPTAEPTPTPEPHLCPVDFEQAWQECADIYGWIEIPGLDISYPVVQHPDNDAFYLRHDITGAYNRHGAIYSEPSVNAGDFSDYHTILYGHNYEDGTLFSNLTQYRDTAVLEANPDIFVYTPEEELRYRIFAAITYSNAYIPYFYDDSAPENRQAFLDSLPSTVRDLNNHIVEDVPVTKDDKILILSTCTGNSDSVIHRYLIIGVLQEESAWDQQAVVG